MNKLFCICLCVVSAVISGAAQAPVPQPTPSERDIIQRQIRDQRRQQEDFERIQSVGQRGRPGLPSEENSVYGDTSELYRKTTNKELKVLAPKAEDLMKYRNILSQPETGLIKLVADKNCFENPHIVVATPDCLAYTMPGAGTSYSFRVKDYRIPRLADITLDENALQASGINLHGIFTRLGDIPLEQVDLQTKGMKFVVDFEAATDFQKAKEIDRQLVKGVSDNGFLYQKAVRIEENKTYVLRSIAYRGISSRFDKRKDVIIVFRIVRRDDDGAVTILWKQLAKQDSPKIKSNKKKVNDQTVKPNFTARN